MRRFLDRLYDAAGVLAGLCVLAIFVVMIGAAVMRQLGLRTGGTDDIVAWLCAAAGFLAMAHTFRHGDFVRVVLLLDRLPPARAARLRDRLPRHRSRVRRLPRLAPRSASSTKAGTSTTWRTA